VATVAEYVKREHSCLSTASAASDRRAITARLARWNEMWILVVTDGMPTLWWPGLLRASSVMTRLFFLAQRSTFLVIFGMPHVYQWKAAAVPPWLTSLFWRHLCVSCRERASSLATACEQLGQHMPLSILAGAHCIPPSIDDQLVRRVRYGSCQEACARACELALSEHSVSPAQCTALFTNYYTMRWHSAWPLSRSVAGAGHSSVAQGLHLHRKFGAAW
jgi:hypothetical protein